MTYQIVIVASAEKEIQKLPARVQDRIFEKIDLLKEDPRPHGVKKLKEFEMVSLGYDSYYRIRVGDYRIIYAIEDSIVTVTIVKVGHRGDIYDD